MSYVTDEAKLAVGKGKEVLVLIAEGFLLN